MGLSELPISVRNPTQKYRDRDDGEFVIELVGKIILIAVRPIMFF